MSTFFLLFVFFALILVKGSGTGQLTSRKIFILMNGSRPFWVSMCHGLGLASRSDTLPWKNQRDIA
jgi:hypothetical protein